jgi:hypothetical protein
MASRKALPTDDATSESAPLRTPKFDAPPLIFEELPVEETGDELSSLATGTAGDGQDTWTPFLATTRTHIGGLLGKISSRSTIALPTSSNARVASPSLTLVAPP